MWSGRAHDLSEPVAIDEMKHLYVLLAGFDDDGNDTDISTGWEKNIGNRTWNGIEFLLLLRMHPYKLHRSATQFVLGNMCHYLYPSSLEWRSGFSRATEWTISTAFYPVPYGEFSHPHQSCQWLSVCLWFLLKGSEVFSFGYRLLQHFRGWILMRMKEFLKPLNW